MLKAPRTDGLVDAFKVLIDVPSVTDILEPTSDASDKIFVPKGNAMLEGMKFSYWSRIVLLMRNNMFVQREHFDKAVSAEVHVRFDVMAPSGVDYDPNIASQAVHEQIYLQAEKKNPVLNNATVVMPFFRVRRPMNCILTDHGYYSSNSIFKTVLGSYE